MLRHLNTNGAKISFNNACLAVEFSKQSAFKTIFGCHKSRIWIAIVTSFGFASNFAKSFAIRFKVMEPTARNKSRAHSCKDAQMINSFWWWSMWIQSVWFSFTWFMPMPLCALWPLLILYYSFLFDVPFCGFCFRRHFFISSFFQRSALFCSVRFCSILFFVLALLCSFHVFFYC